jgi:hypothetical protein
MVVIMMSGEKRAAGVDRVYSVKLNDSEEGVSIKISPKGHTSVITSSLCHFFSPPFLLMMMIIVIYLFIYLFSFFF